MTIDEKFCQVDERAVIERMSGNPAETRQQTNKLSYPVETGSTGSRKPEVGKTTAVSTHYRRLASFRALVLWNLNANIWPAAHIELEASSGAQVCRNF